MKKLLLKFQGRIDIYPPYQAVAIDVDFYRLIRQKVETFFDDQVLGIAQDRFGVTIFQPVLNKKGNGSPSESMNESLWHSISATLLALTLVKNHLPTMGSLLRASLVLVC